MIYYLAIDLKSPEEAKDKYMLVISSNYIFTSLYKVSLQLIKINKKLELNEIRWMSKKELNKYLK